MLVTGYEYQELPPALRDLSKPLSGETLVAMAARPFSLISRAAGAGSRDRTSR